MLQWITLVLACLVVCFSASGQIAFPEEPFDYDPESPAAGRWIGMIQDKFKNFFLFLDISHEVGNPWNIEANIIPWGARAIKATTVNIDGRDVTFDLDTRRGGIDFKGTVTENGQRIEGSYLYLSAQEGWFRSPLTLARVPYVMDMPGAMAFKGTVTPPRGGGLDMTFVFAKGKDGTWVGHADVPIQEIFEHPLINIKSDGESIYATMPVKPEATIEAKFLSNNNKLVGRFKQGSFDFKLEFERDYGYVGSRITRPQNPHPPYDYIVKDITIDCAAGHTLAGTLTLPQGDGPYPGIILVSDSGPQDRDETIFGHKPFLVLADHLTRNGVAVLRYDDRGVGSSTGASTVAISTTTDFADDAEAVFDVLKSVQQVDPSRVGIIGHSEGGLIAGMLASKRNDVACIILLASPGVTGRDLLVTQMEKLLKAEGASDPGILLVKERQAALLDAVASGAGEDKIRTCAAQLIEFQLMGGTIDATGDLDDLVDATVEQVSSPWMKFFLGYDPKHDFAKVTCPILACNGTLDLQVWHEQNLPAIESAVNSPGGNLTVHRYDGLNHLFQPAKTGSVSEYGTIEITIDERVLSDIVNWLQDTVGPLGVPNSNLSE